jgi:hypothetical protein
MIGVRDEGGIVRQGFNIYPRSSGSVGFLLALGRLRFMTRGFGRRSGGHLAHPHGPIGTLQVGTEPGAGRGRPASLRKLRPLQGEKPIQTEVPQLGTHAFAPLQMAQTDQGHHQPARVATMGCRDPLRHGPIAQQLTGDEPFQVFRFGLGQGLALLEPHGPVRLPGPTQSLAIGLPGWSGRADALPLCRRDCRQSLPPHPPHHLRFQVQGQKGDALLPGPAQ